MSQPTDRGFGELDSAWDRVISTLSASRQRDKQNHEIQTDLDVTLLTGFLGSGKTTVLRHVLEHPRGLKIAVLVNDVGQIEVDAHLIGQETSDQVSLSNGCACCALADDLSRQLETLARDHDYDVAIIEASGVADPINIAQVIYGTNGCHLDGIVAVADPIALEEQRGNHHIAPLLQRQLQAAHLVLLSKFDLLDKNGLQIASSAVAEVAPGSRILPIENGEVDVRLLCGAADRGASLTNTDHFTNFEVATAVINPAGPWDPRDLGKMLEESNHQLLRAKGWFDDQQGSRHHLEVVGRRWSIEASSNSPIQGLVLIGLDQEHVGAAATKMRALNPN